MIERELLIMRHAKSGWDTPVADHERPLSRRGRESAIGIGRELGRRGWVPDQVLCSDAERTRETLAWMEQVLGRDLPAVVTGRLYLPTVTVICREIAAVSPTVRRLMVLSHNPACEDLLTLLTTDRRTMTTGNVARVLSVAPTWSDVALRRAPAVLSHLLRPRELGVDTSDDEAAG